MAVIKRIFQVVGTIIEIAVLYLLAVALLPGLSVPQQMVKPRKRDHPDDSPGDTEREDVAFLVDGSTLNGWLYLPEDRSNPAACVVMGHGMGGTKDAGLSAYAERFRDAGYAVLVFDYRYFGESDGEPRQLLSIPDQLSDWAAAITYARSRAEIDPERLALWGTSLSGGHVVVAAARDGRVACVSAQCPAMDGRAGAMKAIHPGGISNGLKLVMHGQRDLVRSWLHLSPHKIPIVGEPGSVALLSSEDAMKGYATLVSEGFVNEVCARIAIRIDKYRPITYAKDLCCPLLTQICDNDTLVPNDAAEEVANILGAKAEVKRYPIGHFDIYTGDGFEQGVGAQIAFFGKHL